MRPKVDRPLIRYQDIDWINVTKQLQAGKTKSAIAKSIGLTPQAFDHHLKTRTQNLNSCALIPDKQTIETYKDNRADIMASIGKRILESITEADIQKSNLAQRTMLYGTLYDKERLERNQSTANVDVFSKVISDANKSLAPDTIRVHKIPQDIVVDAQATTSQDDIPNTDNE